MLSREEFIRNSLELNLFFQRIMKEHLFFIETALPAAESDYIAEADGLKRGFEQLLAETVSYTERTNISEEAFRSDEFVTPYTLQAEKTSSRLTGASLDMDITRKKLDLFSISEYTLSQHCLERDIFSLNTRSLSLLDEVIAFQRRLISLALQCEIFIALYVELLEHVTREAVYYRESLRALQNRRLAQRSFCAELNFWNNIMGEHAQFIDGLLDPTEKSLKANARMLAENFEMLTERCRETGRRQMLQRSLEATERIRNFKRNAAIGLLECEIRSIILPLLADHVLREANHFLRLLEGI